MDKDVLRTDRQQPFYHETRGHSLKQLRSILLTYVQYNNDLGYCQVSLDVSHRVRNHCSSCIHKQGLLACAQAERVLA